LPQLSPGQRPRITPPQAHSSRPIGNSLALSMVEMPPFDCMVRTIALMPFWRSRPSRLRRYAAASGRYSVHRRAREALVFAIV